MVSNRLELEVADVAKRLKGMKKKYAGDPEYKSLRAALPKGWPL